VQNEGEKVNRIGIWLIILWGKWRLFKFFSGAIRYVFDFFPESPDVLASEGVNRGV